MEWKDLLDSRSYLFSDPDLAVFHKAPAMLADNVDSDLKLKKLLEDQTLVRKRHHLIDSSELFSATFRSGGTERGKVHPSEGFGSRHQTVLLAQIRRKWIFDFS